MRITLTEHEINIIQNLLKIGHEYGIYDKIEEQRKKEVSDKKRNATKKATQTRTNNAIKKIENAVNIMRLEGVKINKLQISKKSGVSYNTVNKYYKQIN